MGVQIRMKLSEKCTIPRRLGEANSLSVSSASLLNVMCVICVRLEKFQFLEKWQNRNFGYKIIISVKNLKFILWISDEKTDFTIGIVS